MKTKLKIMNRWKWMLQDGWDLEICTHKPKFKRKRRIPCYEIEKGDCESVHCIFNYSINMKARLYKRVKDEWMLVEVAGVKV